MIKLKGTITENGDLKIDLPPDAFSPGDEVEVTIERQRQNTDDVTWTEEELDQMLRPDPKTGAEIVELGHTGGWEDMGIEDSVEWVQEQRRKRRERRGW